MISRADVENTAKLSRLEFSKEELDQIQVDMNSVISYMEILNKINTSKVGDLVREIGEMREDEICPSVDPEELLKNAPKKEGTAFVVPKVID